MDAFTVRAIRNHHRLSQREFANRLGVSESTIAHIELGTRRVTENMRLRIAQTFLSDEVIEAIHRAKLADKLLE